MRAHWWCKRLHPRTAAPAAQTSELSQRGVDKVLCITPSTPEAIQELRAREDLKSPLVGCRTVWATVWAPTCV